MSIHKTKKKAFEVRWRDKGRQKSKTFKRKIDAEKFEASTRLKCLPQFFVEKEAQKNEMSVEELGKVWLRDHAAVHKSASTLIRDKQVLRDYICPFIGRMKLSQVSKREIIEIQATLFRRGNLKPKSINNVMGLCHKIFADAVSWELCSANPCAHVKPIKCPEIDYKFWTFDERDRFLAFVKSRNHNLYQAVAFAVHTGMRRGEVEALLRDCIDFERREIIVKRNFCHKTNRLNDYTKSKRIRRVPMNEVVYELLKPYMLVQPNAKIFSLDFQHVVSRYLRPFEIEAGVGEISFHDLRHSFASHLAMSGVSAFDIQKLLGHSDIKTTMRYMHYAPDHLKGVTDVLVRKKITQKVGEQVEMETGMAGFKKPKVASENARSSRVLRPLSS